MFTFNAQAKFTDNNDRKDKPMQVAILKYNAGNIRSVVNALQRVGCEPLVTDSKEILLSADKVIIPGQGAAETTMEYLKAHKLDRLIRELRQPVLGICIGQQLLCRHSEEGDTDCLGVFPVDVKRFVPKTSADKIPAMGWNEIDNLQTPLFKGLQNGDFVYFVHSYYVPKCDFTIASSNYIIGYSAALHKDNFYSTQFHPEKSGRIGEKILGNFLNL